MANNSRAKVRDNLVILVFQDSRVPRDNGVLRQETKVEESTPLSEVTTRDGPVKIVRPRPLNWITTR